MDDNRKILNELISEVFVDKRFEIITALKKYQLDESFCQILTSIEKADNLKYLSDDAYVSSLSSSFLTNINSIIGKIKVPEKKEYIQYTVGELSKQILVRLIQNSNSSSMQVLNHIFAGLEVACKLNDWNYDKLKKVVSFDLLHIIAAKGSSVDLTKPHIYYYEWNGSEDDLLDLAYSLKDKKSIKSTNEFLKLFKKHKGNITVRIRASDLDFVIILFDELKIKKIITPKGIRAKHFTPLKAYAVDFEKELLIKGESKHLKYGIVKNDQKYAKLKESVRKWISSYKKKVDV